MNGIDPATGQWSPRQWTIDKKYGWNGIVRCAFDGLSPKETDELTSQQQVELIAYCGERFQEQEDDK